MLCYVILSYVMLCYVMLCYVMLCYVMLCYVMLCFVMLCYVMLCYAMNVRLSFLAGRCSRTKCIIISTRSTRYFVCFPIFTFPKCLTLYYTLLEANLTLSLVSMYRLTLFH